MKNDIKRKTNSKHSKRYRGRINRYLSNTSASLRVSRGFERSSKRLGTLLRRWRCRRRLTAILDEWIHFICGYYIQISWFSEKSQLFFFHLIKKNIGGTHVWKKNLKFEKKTQRQVWEKIYLVAQFGEKNSNFLRNLIFEKISALVAPKPGG